MLRSIEDGGLRLPVAAAITAEEVWDEFHASLLAFIARRVRDRETAEDILQEVMLRIHRSAGELEHAAAIGAWVHQIARNAITDHYRRAPVRREQPAGIEVGDELGPPSAPEHEAARSEIAACLRPLLAQLAPTYREALVLTELEGVTQTAAAAQLDISTSGMKSRVQRARGQLKDLLVECCEIDLDRRSRVTDYRPRGGACDCGGEAEPATPRCTTR